MNISFFEKFKKVTSVTTIVLIVFSVMSPVAFAQTNLQSVSSAAQVWILTSGTPGTVTYLVTVRANGNNSTLNVNMGTSGLPAWVTASFSVNPVSFTTGGNKTTILTLISSAVASAWTTSFQITANAVPPANATLIIGSPSDTTPPTISNITSTSIDGTYGVGTVIPLNVTFSEAVTSAGNVTLTTDTGRTCTFAITSSTTGSCNYTVQAGDNSSDLNVSTVSGTITDGASLPMVNFTPTTNLAANKAIVIDTTAPSVPTNTLPNGTYVNTDGWDFNWNVSTDNQPGAITYEYQASQNPAVDGLGVLTTGLWSSGDLGTTNMIHSAGAAQGTWYWQVRAKDAVGNYSAWSPVATVTKDTIAPVISTDDSFITVWTVSATGADITYGTFPTATDVGTPNPTVNCIGTAAHFALNSTNDITCSATDAAGNTGSQVFTVIISDTIAPTLSLPGNKTVPSIAPANAIATFDISATDDVDTFWTPVRSGWAPAIVCSHLSGDSFNFGATTIVTCTATDSSNNFTTGSFSITVSDTVAPTVSISLSDTNINATDTSLVTFTFSEAPVDFDNADVSVENGTLDTIAGSGTVYTATFTPTADVEDATNVITVDTDWSDANTPAGNAPAGVTESTNYIIDTRAPIQSSVSVTPLNGSVSVKLNTQENATVSLSYGPTSSYGSSADITTTAATSHDKTVLSLVPCAVYHYSIVATDIHGNISSSADGEFTTKGVVSCPNDNLSGSSAQGGSPSTETTTQIIANESNNSNQNSNNNSTSETTTQTNTPTTPTNTNPQEPTSTPENPETPVDNNNTPTPTPNPNPVPAPAPTPTPTGGTTGGGTTGGNTGPGFNPADATLDVGGAGNPEVEPATEEVVPVEGVNDAGGWVVPEENSYTLLWTLLGLIALLNTWWFFVAKNKPQTHRRD